MNARFDTLDPSEMPSYQGHMVLTTRAEAAPCRAAVLYYEEYLDWGRTVSLSELLRRCGVSGDELVVGVDPGRCLGLSVFYAGQEVERSLSVSLDALVSHISWILRRIVSPNRVVRIGDGDMDIAMLLYRMLLGARLPSFRLEFVDEAGTSPRTRSCNRRGMRDMMAARAIAQREGSIPVTCRPY